MLDKTLIRTLLSWKLKDYSAPSFMYDPNFVQILLEGKDIRQQKT